ncbi:ammonium transporter, Amt family, partial [Phenoliferia sp. Uapishka_3]
MASLFTPPAGACLALVVQLVEMASNATLGRSFVSTKLTQVYLSLHFQPNVSYDASGDLIANWDPTGANPPAVYNLGDMSWILDSFASRFDPVSLASLRAPGVAFLYSGLLRRKNALSMLMLALAVYSVATIQWMFWGYSLAFSSTGSKFIGDLKHFGLIDVLDAPSAGSSKIPALLYAFYQSMFAAVTPVIIIGGCAERARILPILVFTFIWGTLVYDPIACWVWAPNGWAFQLGVLDFAGGGPVHMTSGTAAVAWAVYLGKRRGYGTPKLAYRPHSVSHVILGTTLLWFGWFGFNGGSELAGNLRAVQAAMATNLATAMAGLTWMFMDYFYTGKYSAVSLCSGILAGLVGITPAAGYVGSPAALAIGFVTAIVANFATGLKVLGRFDDPVDSFALHTVGGFTGSILTGLFADSRVVEFDGYSVITGGWINKFYKQLGFQLAGSLSIVAYTFVMTYIILFCIDHVPGLHLRVSEESEILGIDEAELGEASYDYVALRRDIDYPEEHAEWMAGSSTPPSNRSHEKVSAEPKSEVVVN